MEKKCTVIALTGGPCGGKTTILAELEQQLSDRGITVVVIPEQARQLIRAGLAPNLIGSLEFQRAIVALSMATEDQFLRLAEHIDTERVVVLCDRGILDSAAYLRADEFDRLMAFEGYRISELFARYDAVIHLVTAAEGAEEFYVRDKERHESPEEACKRDQATRNAWVGHPHLRVIDNAGNLAHKKRRVLAEILHTLGMPVPVEIERKFKVKHPLPGVLPAHARKITIEQAYLPTSFAGEERIRRRSVDGHATHYRTIKRRLENRPHAREEREWPIGPQEYADAYAGRMRGFGVIKKDRWCFLYENQYFELDDFRPMGFDACVLEIELTAENQQVTLPPWLEVEDEVSDDPSFSNHEIARRISSV